MSMTVRRRIDDTTPRVFMHKVADIRGGVSIAVSDLGGDWLREGALISASTNGICHVVKYAKVTANVAASGKAINVAKGHNFKIGDFVMTAVGEKAYAIASIDVSNKDYDIINIGTALGAIEKDAYIYESAAESADTSSAYKYEPLAVVGTGKPIIPNDNINTDAWLIGVTKGNDVPAALAAKLTGIINID